MKRYYCSLLYSFFVQAELIRLVILLSCWNVADAEILEFVAVSQNGVHVGGVTPGQGRDGKVLSGLIVELFWKHSGGQGFAGGPANEVETFLHLFGCLGEVNGPHGVPEGGEDPGVAGDAIAFFVALVPVVFVAGESTDIGVYPEGVFDGTVVFDDHLVVGWESSQEPDAETAGVDGLIAVDDVAVVIDFHVFIEGLTVFVPEVFFHGTDEAVGAGRVALSAFGMSHQLGDIGGSFEPGDGGGHTEDVDALVFFPEVEGGEGKAGGFRDEALEKLRRRFDEGVVHWSHELDVLVLLIVIVERKEHEGCFVFLDGEGGATLAEERVPRTSHRSIGIVFVEKESVFRDDLGTEVKEAAGHFEVTGIVEGVCHEGSVSRPHISVGVFVEGHDVGIVGGDDGTAIIDGRANQQKADLHGVHDLFIELDAAEFFLIAPVGPIGVSGVEKVIGGVLDDDVVESFDAVMILASAEPVVLFAGTVCGDLVIEANGAVDGSLFDGMTIELSGFSGFPGAFEVAVVSFPGGEFFDSVVFVVSIDEEVALLAVVDHGAISLGVFDLRCEESGVLEFFSIEVQVLVEIDLELSFLIPFIDDVDRTNENVFLHVHSVAEFDGESELGVFQGGEGDERVAFVDRFGLPAVMIKPAHLLTFFVIDTDAMKMLVGGMVLHPDMGIVEVTHQALVVEGDEEVSVSEVGSSRHILEVKIETTFEIAEGVHEVDIGVVGGVVGREVLVHVAVGPVFGAHIIELVGGLELAPGIEEFVEVFRLLFFNVFEFCFEVVDGLEGGLLDVVPTPGREVAFHVGPGDRMVHVDLSNRGELVDDFGRSFETDVAIAKGVG